MNLFNVINTIVLVINGAERVYTAGSSLLSRLRSKPAPKDVVQSAATGTAAGVSARESSRATERMMANNPPKNF